MTFEQARYWCFQARNNSYCYAVCYPNGIPLYVGKGRAERMVQHGHCIRTDLKHEGEPQDEKELAIASIHWLEQEERYAVLYLGDEVDALQVEALTIRKLGIRIRGGMLTNSDFGQVQRKSEIWCPPSQPAIKANGEVEGDRKWTIHPDFPKRIRSHKGIQIQCPACKKKCFHPANIRLNGARCPDCFHFIDVDGEAMNAYWLKHRPKLNQVRRLNACEDYAPPLEDTSRIQRFWRR